MQDTALTGASETARLKAVFSRWSSTARASGMPEAAVPATQDRRGRREMRAVPFSGSRCHRRGPSRSAPVPAVVLGEPAMEGSDDPRLAVSLGGTSGE
jgi:hypothetical protein